MKTTIFAIIACLFIGTAYGLDVDSNPNPSSAAGWIDNGTNISLQTTTDAVVVNSTLTVQGNAFSVGGSTLVVASGGVSVASLTVTGNPISGGVDFSVGGGTLVVRDGRTTLSGPNGDLISGASVTASSFWGSGANLSGIPSTAAITAIDFWSHTGADLSPLTDGDSITGSTITATGNAFSVGGSTLVVKDGRVGIGTTSPISKLDVYDTWALSQNGVKVFTSSNTNTFSGVGAGNANIDSGVLNGTGNTFVGNNAGLGNTIGYYNTAVGATAGDAGMTGYANTAIGYAAGTGITDGTSNVLVGRYAGGGLTSAIENVAMGLNACSGSGANNNTCLGSQTGTSLAGRDNVLVGAFAGYNITTGIENVIVGYNNRAGATSSENVLVGQGAFGQSGLSLQRNTGIGYRAGYDSTASSSVFVGYNAGYSVTGAENTLIGYQAGNSITSGSGNIIIGFDVDTNAATDSNIINIGNAIKGTVNGSVVIPSSFTVQGNAFSVGGSTLSVSNGVVSVSSLTTNGRIQFALGGVLTKAQFSTVTPVVGDVYLCQNCTHPYDVCVGTGATLSGFRATVKSGVDGSAKGCGVDE